MGNKFWFASAVFRGAIHENVQITAESGVIAEIKIGVEQPEDSISFGGMGLPGFIDTHCHGGGGFFFSDPALRNIESIAKFHLNNGTTTLFASLVSEDAATLESQVRQLGSLLPLLTIAGIHLEGPWISAKFNGAHDPGSLRAPDLSEVKNLLDASNGKLLSVTIAPELHHALEIIALLESAGVTVALGHTDADAEQTSSAINAGARVVTHFYSCMRPISHRVSTLALESLYNDKINLEFILDGSHIQKKAIQLLLDVAKDRLIAVTDAISAAGMPDGELTLGNVSVVVKNGVANLKGSDLLAGSTLTMKKAYKYLMDNFKVSPIDAVAFFSGNPAKIYNLENVGSIEVGKRANFVVVNTNNEVETVIFEGKVVSSI
jgi:N-acetylglucosamine-6-phosphate deacetylase